MEFIATILNFYLIWITLTFQRNETSHLSHRIGLSDCTEFEQDNNLLLQYSEAIHTQIFESLSCSSHQRNSVCQDYQI